MNMIPASLWRPHILKLRPPRVTVTSRRICVVCALSNNGESLYQILGVQPGADEKQLKRAYRRLALKFHPDVNKEPGAQEKFMRIKHSYQTLVDPSKRAKYESSKRASERRERQRQQQGPEEEFYGLEDFFRDLQVEFQKRDAANSQDSQPKSLWEELADIGEEFLEFLEKELNIDTQKSESEPSSSTTTAENNVKNGENEAARMESQVDEIEQLLAKLKSELGLQ